MFFWHIFLHYFSIWISFINYLLISYPIFLLSHFPISYQIRGLFSYFREVAFLFYLCVTNTCYFWLDFYIFIMSFHVQRFSLLSFYWTYFSLLVCSCVLFKDSSPILIIFFFWYDLVLFVSKSWSLTYLSSGFLDWGWDRCPVFDFFWCK